MTPKQIDLAGGLVGIGMSAIAFVFTSVYLSLLCVLGASNVASNSSRHERMRWWVYSLPLFAINTFMLIGGTCLSAWFYLRVYLLKYKIPLLAEECASLGWSPTADEVDGITVYTCNPLPGRDDCYLRAKYNVYYIYWGDESISNPTFVVAALYFMTTIVFILSIMFVGIGALYQERGIGAVESYAMRVYEAHKHRWSRQEVVNGASAWVLLLSRASVRHMVAHPALLEAFLKAVGVVHRLDRMNLMPLFRDYDFMALQHPMEMLGRKKARIDQLAQGWTHGLGFDAGSSGETENYGFDFEEDGSMGFEPNVMETKVARAL